MPATDHYKFTNPGLTGSPRHIFAITPHDTNELTNVTRAIHCQGNAGDVVLTTVDGDTEIMYVNKGGNLIVQAKIVKATGTTATGLKALY